MTWGATPPPAAAPVLTIPRLRDRRTPPPLGRREAAGEALLAVYHELGEADLRAGLHLTRGCSAALARLFDLRRRGCWTAVAPQGASTTP